MVDKIKYRLYDIGSKSGLATITHYTFFSTMKVEQIKSIISGTEETLRLLQSQPEYQEIENDEDFQAENDVSLDDAIQTLSDLYQGIVESKFDNSQSKIVSQKTIFEVFRSN